MIEALFAGKVDPFLRSIKRNADMAYELGFLGKKKPDLRHLFELKFLEAALQVQVNTLADPDW